MADNMTETTAIRFADLVVDQMKRQHVCVHEGDIAVLLDASKRSDRLHTESIERHSELQKVVDDLGRAQVKTEEIVRQLGTGFLDLQKTVKQNTIEIATNAAEKRTAMVIVSLVSGLIGSLGGIVAMLTFMRGLMPHQ